MHWVDVGTLVGVAAAVVALFIQVRQRNFALAQQYIERFWEIDDSIMRAECIEGDQTLELHKRRYTKLCEDEMEIVSLGWIDRKTWKVWHDGMTSGSARERTAATEADFDFLVRCRTASDHDGSHCHAWTARPGWRRALSW